MTFFESKNSLEWCQVNELQEFAHGFFTRKGGVSTGDIGQLNCGFGADEPAENVIENRARIGEVLGTNIAPQTVFQHHSNDVVVIDKPFVDTPKADAIVTNVPDLPIGILTADCAPILLADKHTKIIAAAHAGWRGAVGGIIENTVKEMLKLGADSQHITAVVGPCISQNNYEVGEDFFNEFLSHEPKYAAYFSEMGSLHFNLPRFVLDQLRACEIGDVFWIGECTYADEMRYYSYRRSTHKKEADYGRLMSAIMIKTTD